MNDVPSVQCVDSAADVRHSVIHRSGKRILLSYPSQYDKGEGVHFSRVLARLGHYVNEVNLASSGSEPGRPNRSIQGYPPEVTIEELSRANGGCDLFLYIEPLGLIPRGLESSSIPTACVLSDVHRNLESRKTLAQLFDHVFLYQRNYTTRFSGRPPGTVHWLPYACDTAMFRDLGLPRDLDVAFIGQLFGRNSERRRVIEALIHKFRVNEQRYYSQDEIPEIYSRAKIVVNLPLADDLNFRFFEALSCGALLLTKRMVNGQEHLFQEGVHYAAFGSTEEMMTKVNHYLRNDDERVRIASAGNAEVVKHHSLSMRVGTLLNKVVYGPAFSAPVREMDPSGVSRVYASVYERVGGIEALLRLASEERISPAARVVVLGLALKAFARRALSRW